MRKINLRNLTTYILMFSVFCFGLGAEGRRVTGSAGSGIKIETFGSFNEPWAMTFLPDGRLLITEKSGTLVLMNPDERSTVNVRGVPAVAYGGQGGLGDVILHSGFKENRKIYFSYVEQDGNGNRGAAVARATLRLDLSSPSLDRIEVLWRQIPKVSGTGHFSHRLAFGPDGMLFITSGERQKQTPAQSWTQNLGKVIRLNDDGSVPPDNPFQDKGELAKTFWTLGHRNLLGIAFDGQGRLWTHEMGPRHGDELNLIQKGGNYGWPLVSWGNQYSGADIPDHNTRPEFNAPRVYWIPSIAPSGLIIYAGTLFPEWRGNAFIGGLVSQALIRVEISSSQAREAERFDMGKRIREVEQGPDGALWLLEDGKGGRLLRLTPFQ